jgi:hypothetical protein
MLYRCYLVHSIIGMLVIDKLPPYHENMPLVSATYSYVDLFVFQ